MTFSKFTTSKALKKEQGTRRFGVFSLLLFSIFLCLVPLLNSCAPASPGYKGYYSYGTIHIKAWKTNNYNDYKLVSDHEYGHYLYNYILTRKDRQAWYLILDELNCGLESEYSKKFKTKKYRYEEEFAESVANYLNNQTQCKYKNWFIANWLYEFK